MYGTIWEYGSVYMCVPGLRVIIPACKTLFASILLPSIERVGCGARYTHDQLGSGGEPEPPPRRNTPWRKQEGRGARRGAAAYFQTPATHAILIQLKA